MQRWGRVIVVTVGAGGQEGAEALGGACNALAATWAVDLGGQGLTCNSVNLRVEAGAHTSSSPLQPQPDCLLGTYPYTLAASSSAGDDVLLLGPWCGPVGRWGRRGRSTWWAPR